MTAPEPTPVKKRGSMATRVGAGVAIAAFGITLVALGDFNFSADKPRPTKLITPAVEGPADLTTTSEPKQYIPPPPEDTQAPAEEPVTEATQPQLRTAQPQSQDVGTSEPGATTTTLGLQTQDPGTTTTTCVPRPMGPNGEKNPDYCY